PAGSATINNFANGVTDAGWDFSAFHTVASNDANVDIFYGNNGVIAQMFTPDILTDIQDAGYHASLDAIDFSPVGTDAGWSPTGTVDLIALHCYIVWTRDDHYAKFQVTGISPGSVSIKWAYQTAAGNPELRARPVRPATNAPRPVAWLR